MYPGIIEKLLTHPIDSMDEYEKLLPLLADSSVLKVFVNIAEG